MEKVPKLTQEKNVYPHENEFRVKTFQKWKFPFQFVSSVYFTKY